MNSINPQRASVGDLFFQMLVSFVHSKKIILNKGYFFTNLVPVLVTDL